VVELKNRTLNGKICGYFTQEPIDEIDIVPAMYVIHPSPGERTCPDTPNRKYPDIVPKGNIPTKLPNRKYPDTKKRLSGYFLLGNRKYSDTILANRKCPDS
jgi:hypothetical protein